MAGVATLENTVKKGGQDRFPRLRLLARNGAV